MQEQEKVPELTSEADKLRGEEFRRIMLEGAPDLATIERYAEEAAKHGRTVSIFGPSIGTGDRIFLLVLTLIWALIPALTVLAINYFGPG